jgi:hypothetical protein
MGPDVSDWVREGGAAWRGTDMRDLVSVGEGERSRARVRVGRPGEKHEAGRAHMNCDDWELFKWISNEFELIRSKGGPPGLQKFQLKYRSKEIEIRNNFTYRNFSRFKKQFELKFREASMSWISIEIHWKFSEPWNLMKFGLQAPCYILLSGEMNFHQKGIRILNFPRERNLCWFHNNLKSRLYF